MIETRRPNAQIKKLSSEIYQESLAVKGYTTHKQGRLVWKMWKDWCGKIGVETLNTTVSTVSTE